MIQLKDISYVRLGSPDLESAENFATTCLGLQIAERGKKDLYLRSDERAHTLCYSEGDPATRPSVSRCRMKAVCRMQPRRWKRSAMLFTPVPRRRPSSAR